MIQRQIASRFLIIFFCSLTEVYAQEEKAIDQNLIEIKLEALISSDPDANIDRSDLTDHLGYLIKHPIDLNKASKDELRKSHLFSEIQIEHLLIHRTKYGNLTDVLELQMIPSFSKQFITDVQPFIRINNGMDLARKDEVSRKQESSFIFRTKRVLESTEGYTNGHGYVGNPNSFYSKIRTRHVYGIDAGITIENDAGEPLFSDGQKGFDFYSGFVQFKHKKTIKKVIIGDFKAQFGQGLTFYSGGGSGKSSEVLLIEKSPVGIKPYGSVNEYLYLRGITAELALVNWIVTPFYSEVKLDGNISKTNSDQISSLVTSGYHRTELERSKKHSVASNTIGINIQKSIGKLDLGLISVRHLLENGISVTEPYEIFRRSNREQINTGIYFNFTNKNVNFFGERAKSIGSGSAIILGSSVMVSRNVALAISYRNYDKKYIPIQSGGFGEQSLNQNEKGIYVGSRIELNPSLVWSVYADEFQFEWLRFQSNTPGSGSDYFTDLRYTPNKGKELYIRLKYKQKPLDFSIPEEHLAISTYQLRKNFRIQYQQQVNENLRWKSRYEYVIASTLGDYSQGHLIFQELKFQKMGSPLSVVGRVSVFDTDNYSSRVYTYEQDVLGNYAIPSFYGEGVRTFFVVKYRFLRQIDFWVKYGITIYQDRKEIGSGLDKIDGDQKSDLTIQMRIKI